jgi:hypothetical protein
LKEEKDPKPLYKRGLSLSPQKHVS